MFKTNKLDQDFTQEVHPALPRLNAEQIARALGGKRSGRQWIACCPAHDDHNPSLLIFDGHTNVVFRCLAGCDPLDIIAALRKRGIFCKGVEVQNGSISRKPDDGGAAEVNRRRALTIWDEGIDPRSTLGETYLIRRGLLLPPKVCMSVVRFHSRCPRKQEKVPALLVLVRDIATDQPRAIQRIFINPRTAKKDKCQASPNGSMMLAPAGGAAMKLTSQFDTFWDDLSFCPRLHVAEGFETALALQNQGYEPIWAVGDAGHIRQFPVLFGLGELVICADNDAPRELANGRISRPGIDAAEVCADRWNKSTHQRAEIWLRDQVGDDFAEPVVAHG